MYIHLPYNLNTLSKRQLLPALWFKLRIKSTLPQQFRRFDEETSPSISNSVIESNQCPGTLYSYQYIMQDQLYHLRTPPPTTYRHPHRIIGRITNVVGYIRTRYRGSRGDRGRRRATGVDLHRGTEEARKSVKASVFGWMCAGRIGGREARGKADTMLPSPASRLSLIHRHWAIVRLPMPQRKTPRTKNSIQLLNYFSPSLPPSHHPCVAAATPIRDRSLFFSLARHHWASVSRQGREGRGGGGRRRRRKKEKNNVGYLARRPFC